MSPSPPVQPPVQVTVDRAALIAAVTVPLPPGGRSAALVALLGQCPAVLTTSSGNVACQLYSGHPDWHAGKVDGAVSAGWSA